MRNVYVIIGVLMLAPAVASAQSPSAVKHDSSTVASRPLDVSVVKPAAKSPANGRLQRVLGRPGSSLDSAFSRIRAEKRARLEGQEN